MDVASQLAAVVVHELGHKFDDYVETGTLLGTSLLATSRTFSVDSAP